MAEKEEGKSSGDNELQLAGDPALLKYLGGTESFLHGENHIGVAIRVTSAGGTESSLVISDVKKKASYEAPIFITKAVRLELEKLNAFLKNQGVHLDEVKALKRLLENTAISCDAFYYTGAEGPLLMMFGLNFDAKGHGGLIEDLSGSKELGDLFDIKGVSLRVFRCDKKDFKRLKDYCTTLAE